jgi:hypothetical protein
MYTHFTVLTVQPPCAWYNLLQWEIEPMAIWSLNELPNLSSTEEIMLLKGTVQRILTGVNTMLK